MTSSQPLGSREDSVRTPTHSGKLLLVGWESYMTSSWLESTKIPPETGGFAYFLTENAPKTLLFKKTFNKI